MDQLEESGRRTSFKDLLVDQLDDQLDGLVNLSNKSFLTYNIKKKRKVTYNQAVCDNLLKVNFSHKPYYFFWGMPFFCVSSFSGLTSFLGCLHFYVVFILKIFFIFGVIFIFGVVFFFADVFTLQWSSFCGCLQLWGRLHFCGCILFWGHLHFWCCLHFWGCSLFCDHLHFWDLLHFRK